MRQFTDGLRPDIRHDINMADVATYMAAVNRSYRCQRGRKDMRMTRQGPVFTATSKETISGAS
ncbi:hypothetical protein F511_47761 [Dorcoceras hygrometricum]|uniref:Uncharacterized protein n=1 Tax=Dorcoceras hygrometricum TaxID=472368 RepID=A0A2Z6ZQA7_9LAMI|nr:hypothetical protein F511_47761 [Dorcoceras hygrometricum]